MLRRFIDIQVNVLCQDLASLNTIVDNGSLSPPHDDVVRFILAEISVMTDYLRLAIRTATFIFGIAPVLRWGTFFHRGRPVERVRLLLGCRSSRVSFFRDFVRFYENLVLLALLSREGSGG